jgi:hypothetical protein
MLEQRYWREEMVRRGGKGRIEEVVVVEKEEKWKERASLYQRQSKSSCLLPWATEPLPQEAGTN